jgi:hypothetical protein
MSILLKALGLLSALSGLVLCIYLWPTKGYEWDMCDALSRSSMAWLNCVEATRAGSGMAQILAIAYAVGGAVSAVVFFAIGHIVDRVDAIACKLGLVASDEPPREPPASGPSETRFDPESMAIGKI